MKRANFVVNIALVPIDFLLVILAAISAYYLRFSENIAEIRPVFFELPFREFLDLIIQVDIVAIIVFALSGFYTMKDKKLAKELPKIITGVSTVGIIIVLSIFWQRELFSSRFILIFSWAFTILYLFAARIIIFSIRNFFLKKGYGHSNIIVLGEAESRQAIVEEYNNKPQLGFSVVSEFSNLDDLKKNFDNEDKFEAKKIDSIIQTDSSIDKTQALDLLTYAQENHIGLKYVASLFQAQSLHLNIISLAGQPIIEIQGTPLDGWRRVYKRIFDILGSLILIIVLSPLFIVLSIMIKISSSGPIIVHLKRVGIKGSTFSIYKFRSMIKDAEKMKDQMLDLNERPDGPLFKIKDDPRITRFGKWLRRTSLDELPQLFNVLRGQMSLVGPRPHEPQEVDRYQKGYKRLLTIKPGITGMAQVSGRSNLPFAEEAKLDIFYIENWSILLDLIILLKTPKAMFEGDRV